MLASLLVRLPAPWRAPALVLATWRRWRTVLMTALLGLVTIGSVEIRRPELTMSLLLYLPPLLGLLVMAGVFSHWRRPSVWTTVAQRRGAGVADGWRLLVLAAALYLIVLGPFALLALWTMPTSGADPSLVEERAAVFVATWGAVSFLTVATVSVFARRGVAGLVIVWMVSPAVLAVAGPALGISKAWLETLAFLAPPFHATARLHDVWSGARSDLTERVLIHLLTFPILCLGLIRLGLQRVVTAPAEAE